MKFGRNQVSLDIVIVSTKEERQKTIELHRQMFTWPSLYIVAKSGFEPRRDFQQCGILTSVDSDEPVQPPFKLRNSK